MTLGGIGVKIKTLLKCFYIFLTHADISSSYLKALPMVGLEVNFYNTFNKIIQFCLTNADILQRAFLFGHLVSFMADFHLTASDTCPRVSEGN